MPKYARRHYEVIAVLLKVNLRDAIQSDIDRQSENNEEDRANQIIQDFAQMFKVDNPSFDCNRFYEACGYKQ